MIELAVTQNTPEWHAQRAGIPTASMADKLITPTGKPSSGEAVERYMWKLIYERIAEAPIVGFQSFWMQRGSELEEEAVKLYEFSREVETECCGFMLNDSRTAGASPDRKLKGRKAGLECKAPKPEEHLMYLRQSGYAWKQHYPQLMFQLMIVKEWDYMDLYSYHDELPPAMLTTPRDIEYIERLENIQGEFSIKLEKEYAAMVGDGLAPEKWRKEVQMPKSAPISQQSILDAVRAEISILNRTQEGK